MSMSPSRGERGRPGQPGTPGRPGKDGTPGSGARGATGATGQRGATGFSRLQTLAIALFVLASFVLLAWRTEVQADEIRENTEVIEQTRMEQERVSCEAGVAILRRFNDQQEALAANDRAYLEQLQAQGDLDMIQQDLLSDRVRIYENAGQPLPDCTRLPDGDTDAAELLDGQLTAVSLLEP